MMVSFEQMEKFADSIMKVCSDMNSMFKDAMSASLQSATVIARGCEELCDSANVLMQKSLDNVIHASKALSKAKNVNELMDMQTSLVKNAFDNLLAEINKITQLYSRIAQQASEPVAQHMNATISKLSLVKAA